MLMFLERAYRILIYIFDLVINLLHIRILPRPNFKAVARVLSRSGIKVSELILGYIRATSVPLLVIHLVLKLLLVLVVLQI
jgi:hypothetical protein